MRHTVDQEAKFFNNRTKKTSENFWKNDKEIIEGAPQESPWGNMRKVVKLSQGVSNIKTGKGRHGPMKLLAGTFRLRPSHHPDFNVEVWDDEERGAEIGTGDGTGNVSEWFIKDVQGEWFKIGSVLQPQLVINCAIKGADVGSDNYGYDPKKLVLWDD